jgi:hypothetical protein
VAITVGTDRAAGASVAGACVLMLAVMGWPVLFLVIALVVSYALWRARAEWPISNATLAAYMVATAVQCLHMLEEYRAGFYQQFPPVLGATPWSAERFLVFNLAWLGVFIAGGVGLARRARPAVIVALFLALGGGVGNGVAHLGLALREGGYFPGAYSAPLALVAGGVLAFMLFRSARPGRLGMPNV